MISHMIQNQHHIAEKGSEGGGICVEQSYTVGCRGISNIISRVEYFMTKILCMKEAEREKKV